MVTARSSLAWRPSRFGVAAQSGRDPWYSVMHHQPPQVYEASGGSDNVREVIVKALNLSAKLKLKMSLLPRKASNVLPRR